MSYTRDQINTILKNNDRAVERAMVRLFDLQTAGEQRVAHTTHQNDEGFCAADAKAGTRFARWVLGMNDRNVKKFAAKKLTDRRAYKIFGRYCRAGEAPIDRARRIALKHSKQLVNIANAKAAAAAAPELNLSKEESGIKNEHVPVDVTKRVVSEEEENEAYWADAQQRHTGKKARDYDCPTNEELSAEMAAESYGASGGDQEELYQQNLARLNKEDAEFMADWNKPRAPEKSNGPAPGTWAATARMMAQGDDSGFDWDRWKDEMKEMDM